MTAYTRLARLERRGFSTAAATVTLVYWPEELLPCSVHPFCDVEEATAAHLKKVVHLSLQEPQLL